VTWEAVVHEEVDEVVHEEVEEVVHEVVDEVVDEVVHAEHWRQGASEDERACTRKPSAG
jgi:hypothetical protein